MTSGSSPKAVYIITRRAEEYNDEWNYFTENGVEVQDVYLDKDAADAMCKQLNKEFFKQFENENWQDDMRYESKPRYDIYTVTTRKVS